jgi:outer membrane protein insertion porin family
MEVAGLGGDTQFLKAEARSRWYYSFWRSPRFGTFTYSLGGTVAYGLGNEGIGGSELPLFERYFPGGLSSIRGFKARTLGPRETRKNIFGQVVADSPIGGSRELVVNNEIIFPIAQSLGLKGVTFFDAGNAFSADAGYDVGDLRYAVGGGVRWLSPLGPLRVELGLPLNRKPREDKSVVLFSFGGPLQ